MQAGLAGGSTDGAAVLVALNKLYNTNLSKDCLAQLGEKSVLMFPFVYMAEPCWQQVLVQALQELSLTLLLTNIIYFCVNLT